MNSNDRKIHANKWCGRPLQYIHFNRKGAALCENRLQNGCAIPSMLIVTEEQLKHLRLRSRKHWKHHSLAKIEKQRVSISSKKLKQLSTLQNHQNKNKPLTGTEQVTISPEIPLISG